MSQCANPSTDDRISDLPDDILCYILTLLPTRFAFATSVLSKRWSSLYRSLTIINFDDQYFDRYNNFLHFKHSVDQVMLSPHVQQQPIKTFRLTCRIGFDDHCFLNTWVEAAKLRGVEEIHLTLNHLNHNLTPNIFTFQTLVVLKLENYVLEHDNFCVDLPLLKTLHLKHVWFINRNILMKILSVCPLIEDLHTHSIHLHPHYKNRPENSAPVEFKSLSLSKVVRAEIDAIDVPCKVIHNVKFLSINQAESHTFQIIPMFRNLTHIELRFNGGHFPGWGRVVELLQNCPKLEILFMKKWVFALSQDWEFPRLLDLECVSSHLKSCTIANFQGCGNDLRFATYILQNARLLQNMTINITDFPSKKKFLEKREIIGELSSCPRISRRCKLSFESK